MTARRWLRILGLIGVVAIVCLPHADGQNFVPRFDAGDPGAMLTPRDRRVQSLLEQAHRELLNPDGDHREALQILQRILDEAEDVFVDSSMQLSLRQQASRILASLPEQTKPLYQATYGAEAASLLQSTQRQGMRRACQRVLRRFFHTSAGAEATFRLAAEEMDSGRLLAAARLFDRLRNEHDEAGRFEPGLSIRCLLAYWRGGQPDQAAKVLFGAIQNKSSADLTIAGQRVPQLASSHDARRWLAEHLESQPAHSSSTAKHWLVPHGTSHRNPTADPVSPLFDDAWIVPLIQDHDAEDPQQVEELATLLDGVSQSAEQSNWTTIPVLTPLIVGDLVVFPSYGLVKAVDRHSGQLQWTAVPADQTYLDSLRSSMHSGNRKLASEMDEFLIQRAWLDATSSQISSDGSRVYSVRDSGMVGGLPVAFSRTVPVNQMRGPRSFNSLRAYDATGGNWLWEIGGARTRVSLPLAGSFFLGPPLPVDGTLYVLGEDLGQVRLHALSPETGDVEWSLPLVNADSDIDDNVERRLAGLSPTSAGGLLICPTGGGLIVAVDPVTRSLVWGTRYRDPQDSGMPQRLRMRGAFMAIQASDAQAVSVDNLMETPRWHAGCVFAAGGSVMVAPPDVADPDDERPLFCLDLSSGRMQWQRPRGGALYVGAIHEQTVLLVGERNVEGVRLADGLTIWNIPLDLPSGRGVRCGSLYHLPLATGEIATIDLSQGTLLARSPVRSGRTLGNLVAVGGRLISQSATDVRSFRTRSEVWQQLAHDLSDDPNSAAALAVRGEFRLHDGDIEPALSDLRSVLTASDDPRSRQLLIATLLEGLRANFAEFRKHVDELDRLTADGDLRGRFLATYSESLLEANDLAGAFQQYLRLLDESEGQDLFDYVDEGRQVRRDRYVQGQLARLFDGADDDLRAELVRLIDNQLAAAPAETREGLVDKLAMALPDLRDESISEPADLAGLDEATLPTRPEAQLLAVRRTGDSPLRAAAAARLIELYSRSGRAEPVVQLLNELESVWAETSCLNGMTGAQWAAAARQREDVAAVLDTTRTWPDEVITVREESGNSAPMTPLRFEGPIDPLTSTFLFLSGQPGQQISIQDGWGQPVKDGVLPVQSARGTSSLQSHYVMQRGHRAVLFLGTQFKLIDLIEGRPQVLLDELLVDVEPVVNPRFRMMQPQVSRQMGFRGQVRWSDDPGETGSVGPLNDSVFCFLRGNTLHAHDPFTGRRYWTVEDVPAGAEIFADADYVLLVPIGQYVVHVYRALDGEKIGVRNLPRDVERNRRGADWGRLFLRQRESADGSSSLSMYDPVSEKDVWERPLTKQSLWSPRDGQDICVLDMDGQLEVIDAETGDVLQAAVVDVPAGMISMYVHSLPDQWLLTTYRGPAADAEAQLAQIRMPEAAHQVVNGPVTAFQRQTGEPMWSRIVASQYVSALLPPRWPVVPLSAVVHTTPQVNGRQVIPKLARRILILDKQTGETIHTSETEPDPRQVGMSWSVHQSEPQLRLGFGEKMLAFSFREAAEEAIAPPSDSASSEPVEPTKQREKNDDS